MGPSGIVELVHFGRIAREGLRGGNQNCQHRRSVCPANNPAAFAEALPEEDYPDFARVPAEEIRVVLEKFRLLRMQDQTVYLRSGSLNVISGRVGLIFSCDGAHYVDYAEFLNSDAYQLD